MDKKVEDKQIDFSQVDLKATRQLFAELQDKLNELRGHL